MLVKFLTFLSDTQSGE